MRASITARSRSAECSAVNSLSGFTPFYISYLMGLARKDRRCLHDLIAGTMVCAKGNASVSYENTFA